MGKRKGAQGSKRNEGLAELGGGGGEKARIHKVRERELVENGAHARRQQSPDHAALAALGATAGSGIADAGHEIDRTVGSFDDVANTDVLSWTCEGVATSAAGVPAKEPGGTQEQGNLVELGLGDTGASGDGAQANGRACRGQAGDLQHEPQSVARSNRQCEPHEHCFEDLRGDAVGGDKSSVRGTPRLRLPGACSVGESC